MLKYQLKGMGQGDDGGNRYCYVVKFLINMRWFLNHTFDSRCLEPIKRISWILNAWGPIIKVLVDLHDIRGCENEFSY
jgi:hypothetical protein